MSSIKDPFSDLVLDDEEKQLEAALANGDYEEAPGFDDTKKMLEEAAKNTIRARGIPDAS